MSSAEGEVSIEQSNLHSKVEEGSILLGVGSVHDDPTENADINVGDGRVHQDLLDIEADMMHSNTTSALNHSSNSTEQHSARCAQDSTQHVASPSATRTTSLDNDEVTADLDRPSVNAAVTQSSDSLVNKEKEGDFDAENGMDGKDEKDAEEWSMMAEGSQKSNE